MNLETLVGMGSGVFFLWLLFVMIATWKRNARELRLREEELAEALRQSVRERERAEAAMKAAKAVKNDHNSRGGDQRATPTESHRTTAQTTPHPRKNPYNPMGPKVSSSNSSNVAPASYSDNAGIYHTAAAHDARRSSHDSDANGGIASTGWSSGHDSGMKSGGWNTGGGFGGNSFSTDTGSSSSSSSSSGGSDCGGGGGGD